MRFSSLTDQSIKIATGVSTRPARKAASGALAQPDATTRPLLAATVLPLAGMMAFCLLFIALRHAGQARSADRDEDAASAVQHTRVLCKSLTGHPFRRVVSEKLYPRIEDDDQTHAEYEIVFQTDSGCHYRDRIDSDTGYLHAFYRCDLPLSPVQTRSSGKLTNVSTNRAQLLAIKYLQTAGHDAKNLKLVRKGAAYADSNPPTSAGSSPDDQTDYLFRERLIGGKSANVIVGVSRKDGELDQLWFPGDY